MKSLLVLLFSVLLTGSVAAQSSTGPEIYPKNNTANGAESDLQAGHNCEPCLDPSVYDGERAPVEDYQRQVSAALNPSGANTQDSSTGNN